MFDVIAIQSVLPVSRGAAVRLSRPAVGPIGLIGAFERFRALETLRQRQSVGLAVHSVSGKLVGRRKAAG